MKKKEERLERTANELTNTNKQLIDPLNKAREENTELKKSLSNYEKDKVALKQTKHLLKNAQKGMKQLDWEHEVLLQRFQKVESERDELYKKFVASIQQVQQKSGLKNLILEKKLSHMLDNIEKKEAQLNEVLSASNLDPSSMAIVTKKLEDVLDSKNGTIKDLEYELARVCKAHNDLLRTYEDKLQNHGIPVEELGFKPMQSVMLSNKAIGSGPAGLISMPP